MKKTILLDRDGVINQDSMGYIKSVDEFIFLPGSIDALVRLTRAGYSIGIATNQSGITRGHYTQEILQAIHEKLRITIQKAGGSIAAIEFCPHLPEEKCLCRKPQPGMLLKLADTLCCDLREVYFIGDRISDIQVALAVGASPLVILSSMTEQHELIEYPKVPVFNSLRECVDWLLCA